MGCSESKIVKVTTVDQCKERITCMKQSVLAHAAFVSAHYSYAAALKNTGAALYDYALSEFHDRPPPPHPPYHSVHPPPENNGIMAWDFFIKLMEDVRGPSSVVIDDKRGGRKSNPSEHDGGGESGEGRPQSSMVEDMKNVDLLKVCRELDDGFSKASESACEVSMFHEANKLHYHSKFANTQGQIKHSTRVMNIIKVDFSCKEIETHATLLDNMLAWEKRLYYQVKAGEKMKSEYQKKIALLNKHRKQGVSNDKLKQTEATVNHLQAAYIVEMQSIDSTVSEINRLRDQHLYPKLVQIVEEMGKMWKNIQKQHEQQLKIVQRLNNIKIYQLPKNTSEYNSKNIEKLLCQVTNWCYEFEKLMLHQKEYIKYLNSWLKLNIICIDNDSKPQNIKIESLLLTWNDELEKLSGEGAKNAICSFASVIVTIVWYHIEEMKMKERCDEIRREITRKTRKLEEWCDKQIAKRILSDVMDDMDVITEQEVVLEVLKRRLEEQEVVYRRHRVQVKDIVVVNFAAALTEVFTTMVGFSGACSRMYESFK